jgi:16S rRNA (guanine527-N7)-methyltransferase
MRAENVKGDFDFIVSRAVTTWDFVSWVKKIKRTTNTELKTEFCILKRN